MTSSGKDVQYTQASSSISGILQVVRFRSLSIFKAVALTSFGAFCFVAGYTAYAVNDTFVNRGRELFGIQPIYFYNNNHAPSPKMTTGSQAEESVMPLNPDPWIQEIADLIGDFYRLFQKMQYMPDTQGAIAYPPHSGENRINLDIARKYKLEQQVVDLLQLLPYVAPETQMKYSHGAGYNEFILYGAFADFRDKYTLDQSRDPLYAGVDHTDSNIGWNDPDGLYMRPYYVALNQLGNHGVVLILNTRNRHLWVNDQEMGQADPGLRDVQETKESVNRNDLDVFQSRPATIVLREFLNKFKNLEWIPSIHPTSEEHEIYKSLYIANGWPDNFNGTAFDIAREAAELANRIRYTEEEPFREVEKLTFWMSTAKDRGPGFKLEHLEKEWKAGSSDRLHDTEGQRREKLMWLEQERRSLQRQVALEPMRIQMMEKELELVKLEVENIPAEIKRAREERIKKYGS